MIIRQREYLGSHKYIVGVIAVVLLIWGPLDHNWTAWFVIRIGYLILIPVCTWYLLGWIWKKWQPELKTELRIQRLLGFATAITFLALAFIEAMASTHIGNTMWIRTRDGVEAVGEDIIVPGQNWGNVIVLLIFTGVAFWFGKSGYKSK